MRRWVAVSLVVSIAWAVWMAGPLRRGSSGVDSASVALAAGPEPLALPGQTATLLVNGEWLIVGGEDANGPSGAAWLRDASDATTALGSGLEHPRAWHTATVLPDGTVLIFGGLGSDGTLVQTAELFNPGSGEFQPIAVAVPPRALHTATLLLDGRVLIAGGLDSNGEPLGTIALWNARTGTVDGFPQQLSTARYGQTATLLANGLIVLSGGTGPGGATLADSEVIDVDAGRLTTGGVFVPPTDTGAPELAASLPESGATDVSTTALLGLRFSTPLQVETVNAETVSLRGPDGGLVPGTVVAAEGGLLAFVTPTAPLLPGTTYTLSLNGVRDDNGLPMASAATIDFTTARSGTKGTAGQAPTEASTPPPQVPRLPADTAPIAGEEWTPDLHNPRGWRTDRPDSPWKSLPPLQAAPGVTALAGQVLALNGQPIPGVQLELGGQTARTDATGRFLVFAPAAGHAALLIDGGATHGVFEVGVDLVEGRTTALSYTIWLPRLDLTHAIKISSPTTKEVVVTTPLIPGLELHIPPGTVIRDHSGKVVHHVSLTPIPLDRPPFPLPAVKVPLFFTAQPGAAYLETPGGEGARLIYPNPFGEVPGWPFNFWNYDADERGWYIYGQGQVAPDRGHVVPDPGVVVYEFTGAMTATQGQPGTGTVPEAEPVDLATGAFILHKTDLVLPDVIPIALSRTYQTSDTFSYRAFGAGFTNDYDLYLVSDASTYDPVFLILPGGRRVTFKPAASGQGLNTSWTALSTPTIFAGATLQFSQTYIQWYLTLRDGTVYTFPGCGAYCNDHPAMGGPISIRDRYGNTVTLIRDTNCGNNLTTCGGNITKITSPHGRSITLTYGAVPNTPNMNTPAQFRAQYAVDNTGRRVNYTYTAYNQLRAVQDAKSVHDGTPTVLTVYTYETGGCGLMASIQDARGNIYLTNQYDDAGGCAVLQQTLAGFGPYTFTYTPYIYVPPGAVCNPDCPIGFAPFAAHTDVTYPPTGADAGGAVRRVVFAPFAGVPLSDTHARLKPEEETVSYNYDPSNYYDPTGQGTGKLTSIVDALNRQTAFSYGAKDNIASITRMAATTEAAMTTLTYEYPPVAPQSTLTYSRLASIAEPGLPPTTLTYYSNGQEWTPSGPLTGQQVVITDPTGVQTSIGLTPEGQLASIADALGNMVQFGYEGGDLTTIIDPNGSTRRGLFDAGGRVRGVVDPLGNQTRYDYDPLNNLTQITDASSKIVTFGYDANSNLTTVSDQRKTPTAPTVYAYDNMDRLSSRTDPSGHAETFANYDFMGNVGTYTDRRGKVTAFTYDRLGRLTFAGFGQTGPASYASTITVPPATATPPGYDKANRLLQVNDSVAGTIVRGYDDFDNLRCESRGTSQPCGSTQPNAVTSTYDPAGRRQSVSLNGQGIACYWYDNADRLTAASPGNCNVPTMLIQYDGAGRRSNLGLPNNNWIYYNYEPASRISSLQYKHISTVLGGITYTYDPRGNVTQIMGDWGRTGLPAATTAAATYDAANHLLSWNGTTFNPAPDLNGNMQTDGAHSYSWDERNQLWLASNANGTNLSSFSYDAFGRRTSRSLYGSTSTYVYDGLNPIVDNGGTLLDGNGVDEYFTRGGGQAGYWTDALGSTVALADANGNVTTSYTYEPFGKSTASNLNSNTFQFTGREGDAACSGGSTPGSWCAKDADCGSGGACVSFGLDYYRARYYSPTWGRFISEDPLDIGGGDVNFYTYVGDNPMSWADPLGLRPLTACEKAKLSPYIPEVDLNNADLHTDGVPWYTPRDMDAITRGNDIYFRPGRYDSGTPAGLGDLGHELVHVGQYRNGANGGSFLWSYRHGYSKDSKYEAPAYAMGTRITLGLNSGCPTCPQ